MIRVLHELSSLDGGGVAKLLVDYYSHIDHETVHFDFLIYDYYDEGIYEEPLRRMGCTIYKLPIFKKEKIKCLKEMRKVISEGKYDIVHSHRGSRGLFTLFYAKKYKVKKRIAHSHIAYEPVSGVKQKINKIVAFITKNLATDLFACGRDAGIYMWGKKSVADGRVQIMTNAIDIQKFKFEQKTREIKRKELGVEDKFVIGIVGRLSEQKNYPFLLKVFKAVSESDPNATLVIIGRGEDEDKIKAIAHALKIEDSVLFLGARNDVPELLNSMDLFVLPSLYEGLPVVLIEAQANGLPAIISDRITDEMNVTDLIKQLPINQSEELWITTIKTITSNTSERDKYASVVKEAGYDIVSAANELQKIYLK